MTLPLVLAICVAINAATWLFLRRFRKKSPRLAYGIYGAIVAVSAALSPVFGSNREMPDLLALSAFTAIVAAGFIAINARRT